MDDLMLLWIDFTRSKTPTEVLRELGANFTVDWLPGGQALDESVLPSEPCIARFDFDDPSPGGLATLSKFKPLGLHPHLDAVLASRYGAGATDITAYTEQKNPMTAQKRASRGRASRR